MKKDGSLLSIEGFLKPEFLRLTEPQAVFSRQMTLRDSERLTESPKRVLESRHSAEDLSTLLSHYRVYQGASGFQEN